MKLFLFLTMFLSSFIVLPAQKPALFTMKKDSSGFELTPAGVSHLALLPLKCIAQQFPNKTSHTSNNDSDHVLLPRQLHPAFYGCFDWHSSVHGHWMLMRLLKLYPAMPEATLIRAALNKTLTKENLLREADYFSMPLVGSWERTYGWAWILKLDEELIGWNDPDAKNWHEALQPLTQKVISLWTNFFPKQTYPNRTGVHPNTAFGLVFAWDYAVASSNLALKLSIVSAAHQLFDKDINVPASWEPNGSDFLSPALEEADLMRRILSPKDFTAWFNRFITQEGLAHLSVLPVVSDRGDLQIVHLDGLSFSRSWCMRGIANALPNDDPRRQTLLRSSINHLQSALPHVVSGEYGGEHWLASFAVYALLN